MGSHTKRTRNCCRNRNIWRFPRIAAQNGGEAGAGAFSSMVKLSIFMVNTFIIAEYGIGKKVEEVL